MNATQKIDAYLERKSPLTEDLEVKPNYVVMWLYMTAFILVGAMYRRDMFTVGTLVYVIFILRYIWRFVPKPATPLKEFGLKYVLVWGLALYAVDWVYWLEGYLWNIAAN